MSNVLTKACGLLWRDTGKRNYINPHKHVIHKRQKQVARKFSYKFGFVHGANLLKPKAYKYIALPLLPCISLLSTPVLTNATSDIEDNITHLILLAKVALERGDIERAEALLQVGLKICDDYKITYGLSYMYDILASIAFAQGDSEKAEHLLVTAIERMVQEGVPESNDHIVDFKLRLARIYSGNRDNALAEIGFKTCLATQKEKILKGDVNTKTGVIYINTLFWYGVHMIKNSRYLEAKKMIDRAYDYSNKIKGLSPYQEMVILYTLADLNMELGEYDVALSAMQTAVMLGKGISSSDLPKCYLKLAKIYMKLGVYDQARNFALEGEKFARMFNKIDTENDAKLILLELKEMNK